MAPSHRFNSTFEVTEEYLRARAIYAAEAEIYQIIARLEKNFNLKVTEIFPHDSTFTLGAEDGVVICWQLLDKPE